MTTVSARSKPGRNDACPCGSGRKYKKCCGAAAPLAAPGAAVPAAPAETPRSCGTCTACCDGWVAGTIRGYAMQPGTPCHFRGAGCCTIYAQRPEYPCRNFVCAWLEPGSPFPEEFRPDRLGVLVIPIRWRDAPAYILRSAGRDADEPLLDWMRAYSRATGRPFFYEQRGERFGFGPAEFLAEMSRKFERDGRLW